MGRRKNRRGARSPKVRRSKKTMTYHGRSGRPLIHKTEAGREYVMVRKSPRGTKRLYLVRGDVPTKQRKP